MGLVTETARSKAGAPGIWRGFPAVFEIAANNSSREEQELAVDIVILDSCKSSTETRQPLVASHESSMLKCGTQV